MVLHRPRRAYLPLKALPVSLDPAQLKIANDSYIFRQIAEGLFSIGEAFQIIPRLADGVEWSADQKHLTIRIKPAKFSDGTPVTAKDVADSMSYCIRNAIRLCSSLCRRSKVTRLTLMGIAANSRGSKFLDPRQSTSSFLDRRRFFLMISRRETATLSNRQPMDRGSSQGSDRFRPTSYNLSALRISP